MNANLWLDRSLLFEDVIHGWPSSVSETDSASSKFQFHLMGSDRTSLQPACPICKRHTFSRASASAVLYWCIHRGSWELMSLADGTDWLKHCLAWTKAEIQLSRILKRSISLKDLWLSPMSFQCNDGMVFLCFRPIHSTQQQLYITKINAHQDRTKQNNNNLPVAVRSAFRQSVSCWNHQD